MRHVLLSLEMHTAFSGLLWHSWHTFEPRAKGKIHQQLRCWLASSRQLQDDMFVCSFRYDWTFKSTHLAAVWTIIFDSKLWEFNKDGRRVETKCLGLQVGGFQWHCSSRYSSQLNCPHLHGLTGSYTFSMSCIVTDWNSAKISEIIDTCSIDPSVYSISNHLSQKSLASSIKPCSISWYSKAFAFRAADSVASKSLWQLSLLFFLRHLCHIWLFRNPIDLRHVAFMMSVLCYII